jgi:hypothetical protein
VTVEAAVVGVAAASKIKTTRIRIKNVQLKPDVLYFGPNPGLSKLLWVTQ